MNRFILIAIFLLIGAPVYAADVPLWNVTMAESSLDVEFTQMKMPVAASFTRFTPSIRFDPARLSESKIIVDVDINSFSTGDKDRDESAQTKEWFDTKNFSTARFESAEIKKISDTNYDALGTLTIKSTTLPLSIPFSLNLSQTDSGNKKALADGKITLDRSRFDLGSGEWKDESIIANNVIVRFHLTAFAK